jgi:multicomponent Na+:H+ antiporter subunit A
VGAVDHEIHERSADLVGGLRRAMPLTALAAGLAALSMAGLPPFFGFISKELIYEAALPTGPMEDLPFAVATIAGTFISSVVFVAIAFIVGVRPFFGQRTEAAGRAHGEPWMLWLPPLIMAVLGIAVGLAPGLFATGIVASAVEAIAGERLPVYLALWHGLTPILALSALTVAFGALIFLAASRVRLGVARIDVGRRVGPERGYSVTIGGIGKLAVATSRFLQNGNLRHYLLTTIATAVVLVGLALIRSGGAPLTVGTTDVRLHELTAAALVVAAAVVAAVASSRLTAIASLGVVGYGVALLYLMFGAPDLAMTQILIETLTLIIFVLVFYHLPGFLTISRARVRLRDGAISIGAGTVMGMLVLSALGDGTRETISGYFIETAGPIAHARNVVNAILVDYRALDTLGEITVLALAGLGVIALLRLRPIKP